MYISIQLPLFSARMHEWGYSQLRFRACRYMYSQQHRTLGVNSGGLCLRVNSLKFAAAMQSPARLSVVLCSDDGNLAMWPDFCGSEAVETQRLAGPITAAAAAALPGGALVACAATAAATILCVRTRPPPGGLQTSVSRLTAAAGALSAGQQVSLP